MFYGDGYEVVHILLGGARVGCMVGDMRGGGWGEWWSNMEYENILSDRYHSNGLFPTIDNMTCSMHNKGGCHTRKDTGYVINRCHYIGW